MNIGRLFDNPVLRKAPVRQFKSICDVVTRLESAGESIRSMAIGPNGVFFVVGANDTTAVERDGSTQKERGNDW